MFLKSAFRFLCFVTMNARLPGTSSRARAVWERLPDLSSHAGAVLEQLRDLSGEVLEQLLGVSGCGVGTPCVSGHASGVSERLQACPAVPRRRGSSSEVCPAVPEGRHVQSRGHKAAAAQGSARSSRPVDSEKPKAQ